MKVLLLIWWWIYTVLFPHSLFLLCCEYLNCYYCCIVLLLWLFRYSIGGDYSLQYGVVVLAWKIVGIRKSDVDWHSVTNNHWWRWLRYWLMCWRWWRKADRCVIHQACYLVIDQWPDEARCWWPLMGRLMTGYRRYAIDLHYDCWPRLGDLFICCVISLCCCSTVVVRSFWWYSTSIPFTFCWSIHHSAIYCWWTVFVLFILWLRWFCDCYCVPSLLEWWCSSLMTPILLLLLRIHGDGGLIPVDSVVNFIVEDVIPCWENWPVVTYVEPYTFIWLEIPIQWWTTMLWWRENHSTLYCCCSVTLFTIVWYWSTTWWHYIVAGHGRPFFILFGDYITYCSCWLNCYLFVIPVTVVKENSVLHLLIVEEYLLLLMLWNCGVHGNWYCYPHSWWAITGRLQACYLLWPSGVFVITIQLCNLLLLVEFHCYSIVTSFCTVLLLKFLHCILMGYCLFTCYSSGMMQLLVELLLVLFYMEYRLHYWFWRCVLLMCGYYIGMWWKYFPMLVVLPWPVVVGVWAVVDPSTLLGEPVTVHCDYWFTVVPIQW